MRTVSVINLKGGVAKTITSINFAHVLATEYQQRVLIVDNDKQANVSKFFNVHSYDKDHKTISDVLLDSKCNARQAIYKTKFDNIHVLSANMNLLKANREVLLNSSIQQQSIIRKAFEKDEIMNDYDFCIFDDAPDINISIINGLVMSDDVIIPLKNDKFAFDGLDILIEQIDIVKENFNKDLNISGCLVTSFFKNDVNITGIEWLKQNNYKVFDTVIRRTDKVDESTFTGLPLNEYSKRSSAAKDYIAFTEEYISKCVQFGHK